MSGTVGKSNIGAIFGRGPFSEEPQPNAAYLIERAPVGTAEGCDCSQTHRRLP